MKKFEIKIAIDGENIYTVTGDLNDPDSYTWERKAAITTDNDEIIKHHNKLIDASIALRSVLLESEKVRLEIARKNPNLIP